MTKGKTIAGLGLIVIIAITSLFFVYPIGPLKTWSKEFRPWRLGLDLVGGSWLIYKVDMSQVAEEDRDSVMSGLRDVIEKRVNLFGVAEPEVVSGRERDEYRLLISLAGVGDVGEAIDQIGQTPLLDFREVVVSGEGENQTAQFVKTSVTGRYIDKAQLTVGSGQGIGGVAVNLEFDNEGAKLFEDLTGRLVGKQLAVFLDGENIQVATVQQKISGGRAQISGQFSLEEARVLVERFNAGALPAPITLINQQTVSPRLGADSLTRAILAGILGTLAVMIFMCFYYGQKGVQASLALIIYVLITLGLFKLIPVTMTLAGVAGFILSIGMAVDANILIFERTNEEEKQGVERDKALEIGFKRAWTSIRDSNISTIITAVILYYFTSSFVQGFALTLLIGVLVSMFSAITVTRQLLRVFYR